MCSVCSHASTCERWTRSNSSTARIQQHRGCASVQSGLKGSISANRERGGPRHELSMARPSARSHGPGDLERLALFACLRVAQFGSSRPGSVRRRLLEFMGDFERGCGHWCNCQHVHIFGLSSTDRSVCAGWVGTRLEGELLAGDTVVITTEDVDVILHWEVADKNRFLHHALRIYAVTARAWNDVLPMLQAPMTELA